MDEPKDSLSQPSGASGSIGAFTGEDADTASNAGECHLSKVLHKDGVWTDRVDARTMFAHLSLLDKLLGPLVLLAMILGVIIGETMLP